jgi:cytochrome d ubiquinol oxidase subunit II
VLIAIAAVSLWTPFLRAEIADRWFSWPHIVILAPVPIITAFIAYWEWRSLTNRSEAAPFIGAICLFMMSYLGIAISLWPMIAPYEFTLWEAASSEKTQAFLLVGTLFLLPIILMYTGWSYWVSRGKVAADGGSAQRAVVRRRLGERVIRPILEIRSVRLRQHVSGWARAWPMAEWQEEKPT